MLLDTVLLVVGLALLVWSADQFVLGSSRLARLLHLPPVVIGAVVMGFGTSAPEMIVSAIAASGGDRALGVGNIVGSNVANLTLVLGTAAFVAVMAIPKVVFRREGPLSIAAAALFAVFVVDGSIERWEGAVLVVALVVVVTYLIRSGRGEEEDEDDTEETSLGRESGRAVIGLVGTVVGAQLAVNGATGLADGFGVSGGFIGFSLVALGTSLPELVTTVACARRSETDLIVGNLFGSNIFNALAVGGVMGVVGPGVIEDDSLTGVGIVSMLVIAVGAFGLCAIGLRVGRPAGSILLAAYVGTMVLLATSATDDDADTGDQAAALAVDSSTEPVADLDGADGSEQRPATSSSS
ncbi:MAG: calcium/sodium antiporter [Actinomycetota bacterium]